MSKLFEFSLSTAWSEYYGDAVDFNLLMTSLSKRSKKCYDQNESLYEFLPKRAILTDISDPNKLKYPNKLFLDHVPAFSLRFKMTEKEVKTVLVPLTALSKKVEEEWFKGKVLSEARIYQEVSKA